MSAGTRSRWTPAMDAALRLLYPTTGAAEIARQLGVSVPAVYSRAYKFGLRKPAEWAAQCTRLAWAEGRHEKSRARHFKPGQVPANKGRPMAEWMPAQSAARCQRTQFQPGKMTGAAQYNYRPVGSLRINRDGLLERKVTDDHPVPARRWVGVHRLVWEAANGPAPAGHVVVFRQGRRTAVESEITLDRLELISRRENMRRNSRHTNYPPEVNRLIELSGALKRKIHNRTKKEPA